MHRIIDFFGVDVPVVVYFDWNQVNGVSEDCRLFIFSSQEQLIETLASNVIPAQNTAEFEALLGMLPSSTDSEMVLLEGDAASSLSAMIGALYSFQVQIELPPGSFDLNGFWEPPRRATPSTGGILWLDPEQQFKAAIVYTKEQALEILQEVRGWLDPSRYEVCLQALDEWNLFPASDKPAVLIQGDAAKLLNWASLFEKVRMADMRKQGVH